MQQPNFQQASQSALTQQSAPMQQQVNPQIVQSALDRLKIQSDQVEKQRQKLEANDLKDSQQALQLRAQQAAISKMIGATGDNSVQGKVGQAMGNGSSEWANMCEAYAEKQIYGHTGIYPDAYSAYKANAQSGNIKTSTNNIPSGAQIFMAPDASNGYHGHTGVMLSNGKFQAPLSNGQIKDFSIPEWEKYSGQRFIGWSKPSK